MAIFGKKNSEIFSDDEIKDAGACPNCWGLQEYDNLARDIIRDKQVDVNNHSSKHAFIKDFVVNHVEGIKLVNDTQGIVCNNCKTRY